MESLGLTPPAMPDKPKPWFERFWYIEAILVIIVAATAVWLNYRPAKVAPVYQLPFALQAPASVAVGEQFTVQLESPSDDYAITAAQIEMSYDREHLQFISLSPGAVLPVQLVPTRSEPGRVWVTLGSGTSSRPEHGVLVSVTFKAVSSGNATIGLENSSQVAASGHDQNILSILPIATVLIR